MLRALVAVTIACAATASIGPTAAAQPKPESAAALLSLARAAIGKPAAGVTSLRLAGASQRRNGYFGRTPEAQEYISYTFEGFIQAPDKYLTARKSANGLETRTGLSGQSLLNLTVLPDGKRSSWQGEGALATQQKEFARMMLMLLLRTDTASAMKLQEPAAPNRSLRFIESDGSTAFLRLDPKTNLPAELRYYVVMVRTGEIREHLMTVDERRVAGGVSFPVRLSTHSLGNVDEFLVLESIELNLRLPPDTFRIPG